jgi:hypothetical protein
MNPTHCPQCETELNGAMTCPNCGWQVPVRHTRLHSKWWNLLGFWALMVGVCGGCGYLAYAGIGAFAGFGPLSSSPYLQWIGIAVVSLYVVMALGKMTRKK